MRQFLGILMTGRKYQKSQEVVHCKNENLTSNIFNYDCFNFFYC
ncbi:hypothetical protein SAMN06296241_1150 [Salinimicrobium sediminis]|uniref:Uncharacterized protein n=1 Tax=Salinimicrobium sediminis TaxID=1343891 RepID=A0A285X5D6_9FLAO|nr:hypothetical protein SAMN06296241_1150 [Salinimicrobium sediminis]